MEVRFKKVSVELFSVFAAQFKELVKGYRLDAARAEVVFAVRVAVYAAGK